jgi:serine/threonine-protein kinase
MPTAIPAGAIAGGNASIEQIEGTFRNVCALKGGVIYCWGENTSGKLGNNTTTSSSSAVKVSDVSGGFANANVTSMSVSYGNVCAITGGKLYCWGSRNNGLLMDGTADQYTGSGDGFV